MLNKDGWIFEENKMFASSFSLYEQHKKLPQTQKMIINKLVSLKVVGIQPLKIFMCKRAGKSEPASEPEDPEIFGQNLKSKCRKKLP